jgi:putative hydrolase of the HAD superfamily
MALRAVLFDAGDTLFRVRGSVGEVYATAGARYGVTVAVADIEHRFREAFGCMPPLAFPGSADADLPVCEYGWWRELVTTVFHGQAFADFDAFFAELFEYFAHADSWELFADVVPALGALRARGLRLGIVSNFDGRLLRICEGLGIAQYFDTIVMSGRAGVAKPDPRIFAAALQRLGVDASEALHVGDSEKQDVAGAQACGLRALLLQRDGSGSRVDCVRDIGALLHRV